MNSPTRQTRKITAAQVIPILEGTVPRSLDKDDYPLIEIVQDYTLNGSWLYLHPSPDDGAEQPRFVPEGESLPTTCAMMLRSYLARSTPPVGPEPAKRPRVFTRKSLISHY